MTTFKITNITNFAGKRDPRANSSIDIEYVDKMTKRNISVKPNSSVYLTVPILPLSVHRLRIKGLITVVEVSENELNEAIVSTNKKTNNVVVEDDHTKSEEKKARKKSKTELE